MHNVKKTPASEAQMAEIKRKRAAALEEFLANREVIFEKRSKSELDEEMMRATAEVLKRHPDIYTFWNMRRSAIEAMTKKKEDEDEEAHTKRTAELFDAEIELTWAAITTANPKSYSAWYQRGWAIERHPNFDFKRELASCEKALGIDHRNFHCWDHRRVVARLAKLNDEEELEFSDRLLKNPSNYSAWHYRGSLLQHLSAQKAADGNAVERGPNEQQRHRIESERLISELQQIQNVCCYNAEDQSGWTYARWLCEAACILEEKRPLSIVSYHSLDDSPQSLFVVANKAAIQREIAAFFSPSADFKFRAISQFGLPRHEFCRSFCWIVELSTLEGVEIKTTDGNVRIANKRSFVDTEFLRKEYSVESACTNDDLRTALAGVIETCRGLLENEDDKNIPWPNYALARTLILLNGHSDEVVVDEALDLLRTVAQIDQQRREVYAAAAERLLIRRALRKKEEDGRTQLERLLADGGGRLDLGALDIQSLHSLRFLAGLITSLSFKRTPQFDANQLRIFRRLRSLNDEPLALESI